MSATDPVALDSWQLPWCFGHNTSAWEMLSFPQSLKNSVTNPMYFIINDMPKSRVPDAHPAHLNVDLFRAGLTGQPPATEAKLPQNTNNHPQHGVEQSHSDIFMSQAQCAAI